jgi:hypothetical protein
VLGTVVFRKVEGGNGGFKKEDGGGDFKTVEGEVV